MTSPRLNEGWQEAMTTRRREGRALDWMKILVDEGIGG